MCPSLRERVATTPPPPTPSQTPLFAATYTVKTPNAWWEEVTVSPSPARTLASVQPPRPQVQLGPEPFGFEGGEEPILLEEPIKKGRLPAQDGGQSGGKSEDLG